MLRKNVIVLIGMIALLMFIPPASMALTGGPDAGGYVYYDSYEEGVLPFEWKGIENDENSVPLPEFREDRSILVGPIDIGFTFAFYGNEYDQIYISKYGYLTFNDGPALSSCIVEPIPTDGRYATENFIAGMWAYLHPGT